MKIIKLNNKSEVTLDEFLTWNAHKQHRLTKETKYDYEKILQNKYEKGIYRKVITPKGTFINASKAADAEGISVSALTRRVRHALFPEYQYEDQRAEDIIYTKPLRKQMNNPKKYNEERAKLLGKVTKTPLGEFSTLGQAAKAHGLSMPTIKRRMKNQPSEFFFVEQPSDKLIISN